MADMVMDNYAYVLNRDIVKCIVDSMAVDYPALINNVVPEKISYALLQKVMVGLLKRGNWPCYMVKTIEIMEDELLKNPESLASIEGFRLYYLFNPLIVTVSRARLSLISLLVSAMPLANFCTSVATTANPLPESPARAASIEAFNASIF